MLDNSSYKSQLDIQGKLDIQGELDKTQRKQYESFLSDSDSDWDLCDISTLPEQEISKIEAYNWNSPRPTTPLSPQETALCFVLSIADGNNSGDVDVIADTFMERATKAFYTKQIISLLELWTDMTVGNLQVGQTRTTLVRNRFQEARNKANKKLSALKQMFTINQTIFDKSVSFDPIPEHTLRLEFSPRRFYYGRSNKTPERESDETMYITVEDEAFLEDLVKKMMIVGDYGELEIKSCDFDQYFLLMDSATGTNGKKGMGGRHFLIGDNSEHAPLTEQFDSYKTNLLLHEEGGFLEFFFKYPITTRKEWKKRRLEKKIPVPAAIFNFWEAVKQSAFGEY